MITVTDDGEGMTLDLIRSVWLVPGDDYRKKQRARHQRTYRHQRLPLGEKGLGRFAVHKLGNRISLVTKARNSEECVVQIDWNELIAQPYLDEAAVRIKIRRPEVFTGSRDRNPNTGPATAHYRLVTWRGSAASQSDHLRMLAV